MPNNKGYKERPESYWSAKKAGGYDYKYNGSGYDFNREDKVTNPGGDYADLGKESGLHGNFDEKDASLSRMKESNQKGQTVCNYSGTHENSRMRTSNSGGTAYNGNPIREVYTPATSHNEPPADAVIRPTEKKSEEA